MAKLKKPRNCKALKNAIISLDIDMTMEELGKKLNYSKAAVSRYLSGFPPSKSFLDKFEEVFEVNLDDYEDTEQDLTEIDSTDKVKSKEARNEIEILKELVSELRERVIDLKESIINERELKDYFKKEYDSLKNPN